ncbi:unnamed protein product [Protopolystoma xenopodis]|uniref:Uncharacterized protein n=1 Tax=Protopolystoma xenopodis TaxID=117903 RepID=A0A448XGM0_9PLAT|nr:unnamed protein product [Protopolystoma xenopodis]
MENIGLGIKLSTLEEGLDSETHWKYITQEDIDEQRRVPERNMLLEMEGLVKSGGNVNQLDNQGATMVAHLWAYRLCSDVFAHWPTLARFESRQDYWRNDKLSSRLRSKLRDENGHLECIAN